MMMIRAALASTLTLGLLAAPLAAEAQSTGRVYRIGVLRGVSRTAPDLHYVEGLTWPSSGTS